MKFTNIEFNNHNNSVKLYFESPSETTIIEADNIDFSSINIDKLTTLSYDCADTFGWSIHHNCTDDFCCVSILDLSYKLESALSLPVNTFPVDLICKNVSVKTIQ